MINVFIKNPYNNHYYPKNDDIWNTNYNCNNCNNIDNLFKNIFINQDIIIKINDFTNNIDIFINNHINDNIDIINNKLIEYDSIFKNFIYNKNLGLKIQLLKFCNDLVNILQDKNNNYINILKTRTTNGYGLAMALTISSQYDIDENNLKGINKIKNYSSDKFSYNEMNNLDKNKFDKNIFLSNSCWCKFCGSKKPNLTKMYISENQINTKLNIFRNEDIKCKLNIFRNEDIKCNISINSPNLIKSKINIYKQSNILCKIKINNTKYEKCNNCPYKNICKFGKDK